MNPNHPQYVARRKRLMAGLPDNALVVVPGAAAQYKSRDTEFPFRQDSDFYYLTGFCEPEACLLLSKRGGNEKAIVFLQPTDPKEEQWTGPRLGPTKAPQALEVEEAYANTEMDVFLNKALSEHEIVFSSFSGQRALQRRIWRLIRTIKQTAKRQHKGPLTLQDLDPYLHELRVIKDEGEIVKMQRAATISAAAHRRAMQACRPGVTEYQLEAEIMYEYLRQDARLPAYNSIVGAGANACVLHYTSNRATIQKQDAVLIDAGCEWNMYCADITRTFPASGRFEGAFRDLYEVVLDAQLAGIRVIKPGVSYEKVQTAILNSLVPGLVSLGILIGDVAELIRTEAYKPFYMHSSGHWLGLDVHDVGRYQIEGKSRPLEKGMVLTVEPGIYIAQDAAVPPAFRGIGIRIEDDILVEEQGFLVLSREAPKTISDIEACMAMQ